MRVDVGINTLKIVYIHGDLFGDRMHCNKLDIVYSPDKFPDPNTVPNLLQCIGQTAIISIFQLKNYRDLSFFVANLGQNIIFPDHFTILNV